MTGMLHNSLKDAVRNCIYVVLVALFLRYPSDLTALEPDKSLAHLIHRSWQTKDGLPQNSVYCLVQDQSGYLWFGTENGLVRFNGTSFDVFTEQSKPAIPHNFVSSLLVAADGTLWCGTRTGGLFHYRDGGFRTPFPSLATAQIWALAQTSNGEIWVGTRQGLARIRGDSLETFGVKDGLAGEHITALHAGSDGQLWIGMRSGATARWTGSSFEALSTAHLRLTSSVRGIAEDSATGDVWIAHDGDGLFVYRSGEFARVKLSAEREVDNCQALLVDREGSVWVGTQYEGIVRLRNGSLSRFGTQEGLTMDDVLALTMDREGSVWIGTLFGGLNRLHAGPVRTYSAPYGLRWENLTAVVQGEGDSLLIGTESGGMLKFSDGTFTSVPIGNGPQKNVRTLLRSRTGEVWIGTEGGLASYNNDGEVRHFTGLVADDVASLFESRSGALWIGSHRSGFTVLSPDGTFRQFTAPPFLRRHIRCFSEDSRGNIWIGTQSGLVHFDGTDFREEEIDSVPDLSVRSLFTGPDDTLWIASRDHGLIRLRNGSARVFNTASGLAHNRIYQIIPDENVLWLAGNRGVERVALAELEMFSNGGKERVSSTLLTERDGFRTPECAAATLASDGKLWVATRRGLSVVDTEAVIKPNSPPPVVIKAVEVDHQTLNPEQFRKVPAGSGRLRIEYAALALRHPEKVTYEHKLEPVDEDWISAGTTREAVYHTLRPGEYQFKVRARNGSGPLNESGPVLGFFVAPRFYQTFWFQLGSMAAALAGVAGLIRWRTSRISGENEALESLVAERTVELEREVATRRETEDQLRALNSELEDRVQERTRELSAACDNLQVELRERQNAEQALARSEARLRRIVDSGMVGILFWQKDGRILDANNTFLRMIGYSREELERGEILWTDLTPPELLHLDKVALEEIQKTGVCSPFEKEYIRKDRSRIPILLGGASFSPEGERGVCFALDISERKAWEDQIRELNHSLEARVQERTVELARMNEQLAVEIAERKRVAIALSAFSHLGQRLHGAHTEKEAAEIVAHTARSLIPHELCYIELYGPDQQLYPVIQLPVSGVEPHLLRASISVSIRNGSRVVGILGLKSQTADAFNSADLNTLQALGDYCGGALDRIHAEEARRETERRFSAFMANAPALAWMKDSRLRYVFTNEMFQKFTGIDSVSIEGKSDFEVWPEPVASLVRANDSRVLESQLPLETQEVVKSPGGEERILLALRFLFTTSAGHKFIAGMAVDITEKKRGEEALHRLPQSILEAQEKERRRVARELHDGVNQAIASAKFRIQTAEQQIARGDLKWQETCSKTKEMLDSVLQQVRRISRNLRPGELDDLGLIPAARAACQEFESRTGISVRFSHQGVESRLPGALELTFYRVIQEALTNIEKHSGATSAEIALCLDNSNVVLEISDTGRGFESNQPERPTGLGLLHMRERASLIGGTFTVRSAPGAGVRIRIEAPVPVGGKIDK